MPYTKSDAELEALREIYYKFSNEQDRTYSKVLNQLDCASAQIELYHKKQLTGTTASVLLGNNPWQDTTDLYNNFFEDPSETLERIARNNKNIKLYLGRELEASIANYVNEFYLPLENGITVTDFMRPWSSAQIDRIHNGCPFEIKTVEFNRKVKGKKEWGNGCIFKNKGEIVSVDSQVPQYYYDQVQKQMYLNGSNYAFICAYFKGDGVRIFKIEKNQDHIDAILNAEDNFMFEHVIPRDEPDWVEPLDDVEDSDGVALADDEFIELVTELRGIRLAKNELADKDKVLTAKIKKLMGTNEIAVDYHGVPLTRLSTYSKSYFDKDAFVKEHSDLYKKFTTNKTTSTLTICARS